MIMMKMVVLLSGGNMVIHFKEDKEFKNTLISLVAECILKHKNLYEEQLFDILKEHPERISPADALVPRKGWGWTFGTLRYFSSYDQYTLFIPESNKIDKDSLDELRSEDICIRANKTDILESLERLERDLDIWKDKCGFRDSETYNELNHLKILIKGE